MHPSRGDRTLLAAQANNFQPTNRDKILTTHHEELDAKVRQMDEQLKVSMIAAEKSDAERRYEENRTYNMRNAASISYPANPFGISMTKSFVDYRTTNTSNNKGKNWHNIKVNDLFGAAHVDQVQLTPVKMTTSHDFTTRSEVRDGDNYEDISSVSTDKSDADADVESNSDSITNYHIVPLAQYKSLSIKANASENAPEDQADFMKGWIEAVTTFQMVSEDAKMDLFAHFVKLIKEADEYQLGRVTIDLWHHKFNEVFTKCFDLKMDHTFMHRDGVPFGRLQWEDTNFTTEEEKKTLSNYKKKIRTECVHQVDYIRDTMNSVICGYSVKGNNKTFTTVFYQYRDIKHTLNILLETYADNSGDKKTALDDLVSVLDKSVPLTSTNYAGYSAELREVGLCVFSAMVCPFGGPRQRLVVCADPLQPTIAGI